jgi:hypothetical protein
MKNPGVTSVIALSLAIGIGVNTAIFSVTSALLPKPLPYPHADRLAILWLRSPGIGSPPAVCRSHARCFHWLAFPDKITPCR